MLWLTWLQHKNGPARAVRHDSRTECRREVIASAVHFVQYLTPIQEVDHELVAFLELRASMSGGNHVILR
ncbi:hypothetical protein EVAR_78639_1 [Eumeta japonica]|uniref:Uncharacterized protein n=1 Tax=Eumeta variegata TaxID=151549 RepID=A0A4C1U7S1_EUMVA|nr:hypothetical protein EVAR_78639_1 [Eumeta japonica]